MPIPAQTPAAAPQLPPPPAAPGIPIQTLQAQVTELTIQLAGLRAERSVLKEQLGNHRMDPAARAEQTARYADVSTKVARAEADLDRVVAQIRQAQGSNDVRISRTGQIIVNPPVARRAGPDPDMVVGMSFVLGMCLVLPISIAIAKRIWRGRSLPAAPRVDDIAPRLDRLEQAVDAIAIEVERVSEGQRFVTKVLTERPIASRSPSAPESNNASALNDAKPLRALGAGPAEPIRMPERQAVRQSVTPH
jgi:hypothetical protein